MKRLMSIVMVVAMVFFAVGCGSSNAPGAADPFKDVTLEQLAEDMTNGAGVEIPSLETMEINAENEAGFLGVTGLDYKEALACEPMISAIAYSVCLVRMNEGADVEAAKTAIKDNVNPAKWICVQVDPSNVIVESAGNVIVLIMSNDYAAALSESFNALAAK
ncbi:hypothetical protein LJC27_03895 [Christensenellaceae bacterium OttesenSCG-928-M15]|nr:hypothetical protein [Christensenellaceae bacterium OttesenSCG-928-M15]